MTTWVVARVVRARLNADSFAQLTPVPVVKGGITPAGVDFDGDLTPQEAVDVWWFLTSRDDADEAQRRNLAALRDAAAADPSLENVATLATATVAYVLGES